MFFYDNKEKPPTFNDEIFETVNESVITKYNFNSSMILHFFQFRKKFIALTQISKKGKERPTQPTCN